MIVNFCQLQNAQKEGFLIAYLLREQRRLKSKTQNDLATTLKINRAAYGEYELGNHLPTVDKLVALAAALDVSIESPAPVRASAKNTTAI